jgi:hypothetical protein
VIQLLRFYAGGTSLPAFPFEVGGSAHSSEFHKSGTIGLAQSLIVTPSQKEGLSMKKVTRPFIIEYRSKRGRSRSVRGGESSRFADQSAERIFRDKDARDDLSVWQALFKQGERAP